MERQGKNNFCQLWTMAKRFKELRGVVKNGLFTVSPLGPDHKQMCNFDPFVPLKFDSLILKTHFVSF